METKSSKWGSALDELAKEVREAHESLMKSCRRTTLEAIELGKMLSQAQALTPRSFQRWIAENCPFSYETARRYIRLFEDSKGVSETLSTCHDDSFCGPLTAAYRASGILPGIKPAPKVEDLDKRLEVLLDPKDDAGPGGAESITPYEVVTVGSTPESGAVAATEPTREAVSLELAPERRVESASEPASVKGTIPGPEMVPKPGSLPTSELAGLPLITVVRKGELLYQIDAAYRQALELDPEPESFLILFKKGA